MLVKMIALMYDVGFRLSMVEDLRKPGI